MKTFPALYKRDVTGKVRVWWMELDGSNYRSCSGVQDGQIVCSGWTSCEPRSQDTAEAQADFEVRAEYTKKLDREYHATVDTIDHPRFFKPMLAHKYEGWLGPCYSQPKLDGIRCIVTKGGMFSRQGKKILGAPHIREGLEPFFQQFPTAILDGELYNHDLKDDFNTIVSAVKKQNPSGEDLVRSRNLVQYHVYDTPSVQDVFEMRNYALEQSPHLTGVHLVETVFCRTEQELDEAYGAWLGQGYEGQMVRLNGPYEQKRSKLLLKRKEFQEEEFPLIRIEEGNGNWAGLAKAVVCGLPDGREFSAGIKGDRAQAARLLTEQHDLVSIRFQNLTPDGIPRFGVATKFHGVGGRL